jgi:NTP pyrophosphatase (non-canonical NTP hydrolase)
MTLNEIQKQAYENKVNKGFNTTNIEKEFCLLYGEVGEAYEAFRKKKDDLGSELADIAIYLLGLSEMLGFSLQDEIEKKMSVNEGRTYENINGVLTKKK